MSQKHYTSSTKVIAATAASKYPNQQAYQPIPTISMDNPAMTRSASSSFGNVDDISVESGRLPSTYSSQQLMPASDSDSIEESARLRAGAAGEQTAPATYRSIGGVQWFSVAVLCFVNLINYMDRYTIAGVLTDIQVDFGIGDDGGGLLQTAFVLSYMVCAPLFGYLGDRYSRRWIMAIGVFLWSTTTLLGSFMNSFGWFITFRALVGIGEASYSTIAPTIISDLFVQDMRSQMLALFYFAIPVGSGLGYIVGAETARFAGNWRWALRVTPLLGIIAVILILITKDPPRGASEGVENLAPTTYCEDINKLVKNRSFMLSTAGFTCVAFVTGALAWFAPKFMYLGMRMQPGNEDIKLNDVSYKFGIVAMFAGLIGVPLGSIMAQRLRPTIDNCDPYICAVGLLISAPMVFASLVLPQVSVTWCFIFVFIAQVALNLCWSIVADILLYVVQPNRRSTAEAFQILISHALGDAGSPYLVGVISEMIKKHLRANGEKSMQYISGNGFESLSLTLENMRTNLTEALTATTLAPLAERVNMNVDINSDSNLIQFEALQYALFTTSFVEVLGGIFFLITAAFIVQDRLNASSRVHDSKSMPLDSKKNETESIDSDCFVLCTDIQLKERT